MNIDNVIRLKSQKENFPQTKSQVSAQEVEGYRERISQYWKRDCLQAAELERLRGIQMTRVFERSPWFGWRL